MPILSILSQYDRVRVHLDEQVRLAPNTCLIVTVLDDIDTDREEFLRVSAGSLAAYYDEGEVEYSEGDLKLKPEAVALARAQQADGLKLSRSTCRCSLP